MSRAIGFLLTVLGGLALAAGVGIGVQQYVSDDEPIERSSATSQSGQDADVLFPASVYGNR